MVPNEFMSKQFSSAVRDSSIPTVSFVFLKILNYDILSYFVNSFTVRQMIFSAKFLDFFILHRIFSANEPCDFSSFLSLRTLRTRGLSWKEIEEKFS